jgi:hypothetical protein
LLFNYVNYIKRYFVICSRDPKPIILERLLLGTLAVAYRRKNVSHQGPFPSDYRIKMSDSTMTLYLDHGQGHIDKKHNAGFEVDFIVN